MKTTSLPLRVLALGSLLLAPCSLLAQGSLTPPGAPGPTMKTLDQLEPRRPIRSVPTTITNSGSYYVTTNLDGADNLFLNGITIQADSVTIDLGGFELVGGIDTGAGILVSGDRRNIRVFNGTVRAWEAGGIRLATGPACAVEHVQALSNIGGGISLGSNSLVHACIAEANSGGDGIRVGPASLVSDCTARSNSGGSGISVSGLGAIVRNCVADGNLGDGIMTGEGCTVESCTASRSLGDGIHALFGARVSHCTAYDNVSDGIQVGAGSTVLDSTAYSNTNGVNAGADSMVANITAYGNGTNGILTAAGCTVRDCTVNANRTGIQVPSRCRVVNNQTDDNINRGILVSGSGGRIDGNHSTGGQRSFQVTGTDNLVIRNSAQGASVLAYDIAAGNHDAARISSPGSTFTNSSPWANFSY